ncbi:MAG: Beta-lactamase class [Sedimentibacter sp.]|jgi:CubicO group peptidase (beta-lactamase class C family)|nr:Beta-lactamase class [Sedimentibacter sp.]
MDEQIDLIIQRYISEGYFPSAVCHIFSNQGTIYNKAFGNVKIDTLFDVASLSKIVTSTEILMLVNEGKVDLNEKVSAYLPIVNEFETLKKRLSDVTVERLLTHNSGIIDWYPLYAEDGTVFEVMNKVIGQYEKFEGTLYSDLNFMLLGEIIKSVTKLTLEESLEKYIKQPLNIKNICYCPKNNTNIAPTSYGNIIEEDMCKERNIKFNNWRKHGDAFVGEVNDGNAYYFFNGIAGHAGIFADVQTFVDLCKYYMTSDNELIKSSMKEHRTERGLGWQITESYPHGCGHSGFTGTSLWICKERNIAAVIFTNRLYTENETKNLNDFRKEIHSYIYNNLGLIP